MMEKLTKEQAERILSYCERNFRTPRLQDMDHLHFILDQMTEQSPEDTDYLEGLKNIPEVIRVDPWKLSKYLALENKRLLSRLTEPTPEEELAGYKCPYCSFGLYLSSDTVFCIGCEVCLGLFDDFKGMPCYQPEWNEGK